jgi:hypothetical protein
MDFILILSNSCLINGCVSKTSGDAFFLIRVPEQVSETGT